MEEKGLLDDTESLLVFKYKGKLMKDAFSLEEFVFKKEQCSSKKLRKRSMKWIEKDYKSALKQISEKVGVAVEIPEIKDLGGGMYKTINSQNPSVEDIITVNTVPVVEGQQQKMLPENTDKTKKRFLFFGKK